MPEKTQSLNSDERKELEALREQVAQFEDIVRCLPIGLIFVDADDNVVMANPIGAEIRCVGDRLGASVSDCHPIGTHTTLERVMERFRTEPQMQEHPIVLERMHRYEVTYSRVATEGGEYRGVLWLSHDISRRKMLERELMHAERLAGLGRMAAKVAHDIKNPLNAIQGAAHFLQQDESSGEYSQELTTMIKDQVARIAALVNHLNELTRPFEMSMESVDLEHVVREQLQACSVTHPGSRWSLDVDSSLEDQVQVDRALLERLICNAAENACLSMDGAGTLDVRIRRRHEENAGWVDIEFEDSGPGFPAEVLQNLFQPFLTTREDGTGLGLTIMREICLLHGGDLVIENTDDGALVTARLSAR
jgi:nitrogen fixation/metabolism regulation signal transduction histidine kinase